jgi:hypothetical protein
MQRQLAVKPAARTLNPRLSASRNHRAGARFRRLLARDDATAETRPASSRSEGGLVQGASALGANGKENLVRSANRNVNPFRLSSPTGVAEVDFTHVEIPMTIRADGKGFSSPAGRG